jgi:Icc-related predicted phosphoesterase
MRIYAVADIHGHPERFDLVWRHLGAHRPDVLVLAGDLGRRAAGGLARLARAGIPMLAVRGNGDPHRLEDLFAACPRFERLHLRRVTVAGVGFVGVDGTLPLPFASRLCLRERRCLDVLEALVDDGTVLVGHPPPRGIRDAVLGRIPSGSGSLKALIRNRRPVVYVCGHIHEQAGWARLGKTVVVNASMGRGGGGALVDIAVGAQPCVTMLDGV